MLPRHPQVAVLGQAYRFPLALRSCKRRLAEMTGWLNWLAADGVTSLHVVTQQHCERYLQHRRARRGRDGTQIGDVDSSVIRLAAAIIIELAHYRELFTADVYPPGFRPWQGRSPTQVAGMRLPETNKTPVLRQQTLQPILAAALYLTDTLGPHVAALGEQIREQRVAVSHHRAGVVDIIDVLDRHRQDGKRAGVLHLGIANYCWFADPSRALCLKLAGTPDADKPLAGMCDSARCPQATHHPCHRPVWAQTLADTTVFLGQIGRNRKTERTRLHAELDRASRVLDSIDAATAGHEQSKDQ